MTVRLILLTFLVCCTADAAQAFRFPFFFSYRHHGHGHSRYRYAVPIVPRDCTKINAARRDITEENWRDVERTLTEAQRRFIDKCMAEP